MLKINKEALRNSLFTALYIAFIGSSMYFISTFKIGNDNTFLAPIAFLLLFVLSAAITSFLVFGKPAQLYIDGKKKEAISLLTSTIAYLAIFTVVIFVLLLIATTR